MNFRLANLIKTTKGTYVSILTKFRIGERITSVNTLKDSGRVMLSRLKRIQLKKTPGCQRLSLLLGSRKFINLQIYIRFYQTVKGGRGSIVT
jgi:hypothetical protein